MMSIASPPSGLAEYVREVVKIIVAVEVVVWSDHLKVAGTIDRVVIMKGDTIPSIDDLKTGSLYDEIGIKLAGYMIMWNEMNKLMISKQIHRRLAIQLPRKDPGQIKVKEYTKDSYVTKFVEACEQYYALTT